MLTYTLRLFETLSHPKLNLKAGAMGKHHLHPRPMRTPMLIVMLMLVVMPMLVLMLVPLLMQYQCAYHLMYQVPMLRPPQGKC